MGYTVEEVEKFLNDDGFFSDIQNDEIYNDKEIILNLIRKNLIASNEYKYIGKTLMDDDELVQFITVKSPHLFEHSSERLKDDKTFILNLLKISKFIKSPDNERDIHYLKFISERLKNDIDIANIAIELSSDCMCFLNEEFLNNHDFSIKHLKCFSHAPQYFSEKYTDNRDYILPLIKKNIITMQYVSERLKDDEELAEIALSVDSNNITFISDRLARKFKNNALKHLFRRKQD